MSNNRKPKQHRPTAINRDHARPRTAPAPFDPAVEARLTDLISPATYGLANYYNQLGLRWRILNLPVMVALILTMIWRQVPSVQTLIQMITRKEIMWAPRTDVSQQAFSDRLRSLPAEFFSEVFQAVLPQLSARAEARTRPQPPVITRALQHFDRMWIVDATTLEALFCKVGLLRGTPNVPLGGKLLAILDLPTKLPIRLWWDADPNTNEKAFLDEVKGLLQAGTLLIFDRGFYSFPFFDWLTENGVRFVTRARDLMSFRVEQVLFQSPNVRDRIIALGTYRSNPCQHRVRLVEVCIGGLWHRYLTTGQIPSIRFDEATKQGNSLFRPFALPKPYTLKKDVFCLREHRTTDGYRKISLHNHEIELPNVPLREEVEIHMVPDPARGAMEVRVWWENKMNRSVVYPLTEFPRVHF